MGSFRLLRNSCRANFTINDNNDRRCWHFHWWQAGRHQCRCGRSNQYGGGRWHTFFLDAKQEWHLKNMVRSRNQRTRRDNVPCQKKVKKRCQHRKNSRGWQNTVQYNKSIVLGLTYLIFSWQRRPPSWLTMLTLSWYGTIDIVLFFWYFENRDTPPHH